MTEVQVYVASGPADVLAGTLYSHRRLGTEFATFTYASDYLARADAYALDPELPLSSGARQTRVASALFGAFTDCAPDRWGRTLLTRREAAMAHAEGRARKATGSTCPTSNGSSESAAPSEGPKAHVRSGDGRVAIAKFPSGNHDTWNVMAWEKVALDLASRTGIDVPVSRLLGLTERSVLLVDRFDRTSQGDRIGYVSAMTMLEASDGDQRNYLDIAELIENVSASATRELHQLWRRIVFSVLISNTDDHLRNHGFVHDQGDVWRLAPAFDLNPSPEPGRKQLSTAIDHADDTASPTLALSTATYFRLSETQAREILAEVTQAMATWRRVAAHHGLTPSEVSRMEPAFAALADAVDT